jgi:hypothetical protein
MPHELVKILSDDKNEPRELYLQVWHLVDIANSSGACTLCEGEYFGVGESGCEFEVKSVKRGGITCKKCLDILKAYKKIKL